MTPNGVIGVERVKIILFGSDFPIPRGVDPFPTLGGFFLVLVRKSGVCQHWADILSIPLSNSGEARYKKQLA